jgi:hypothetical protein
MQVFNKRLFQCEDKLDEVKERHFILIVNKKWDCNILSPLYKHVRLAGNRDHLVEVDIKVPGLRTKENQAPLTALTNPL